MRARVLMIAYACDPRGSGEHWLGWGWAEQAARDYAVDLITTPKARAAVEEGARALGITPHFVETAGWLRKLTELTGERWLRKLAWQRQAAALAAGLHRQRPFALVHQTTFHTFRIPFLATRLGIPSVWGPVAGGERVPPGFGHYLGSARFSELGRQATNQFCLALPSIRESLRRVSAIFVSNRTTLDFLPSAIRPKCQIVPPNALRPEDESFVATRTASTPRAPGFRLIYIGNCVATRCIPLVLEALARSGPMKYEFTVVGSGPALPDWKRRAARLGVNVNFAGQVPRARLQEYYAASDALVFPALRDSGGSALLEAMARQVPVICLDWGGPGEMVEEATGIKIPVSTPEKAIAGLAAAILRLENNPSLRNSLAVAARARSQAVFSWQAKRNILTATYRRLIGES